MSRPRFFTDEDVHRAVAKQLRALGYDAVSTPEVGQRGLTDESHLIWAAAEARVILTCDVGDYARLHTEWLTRGDRHAGLVVSAQRPIGDLIRRLHSLGQALTLDDMRDRLEYLSNWPPS